MATHITKELLEKYLRDSCTPQEKAKVEEYLRQEEDLSLLSAVLENEWTRTTLQAEADIDTETSLKRFKTKREQWEIAGKEPLPGYLVNRKLVWVLATLMLIMTIAGSLVWYRFRQSDDKLAAKSIRFREIITANGQQGRVVLSDGSEVWLHAGSKIKFPEKFSHESRPVWLSGEAIFEIRKDSSRPFIVHTHHLTTTVTGTSFYVSAYEEEPEEQVVVTTGKVMVCKKAGRDRSVLLSPRQRVVFQINSQNLYRDSTDLSEFTALQNQELYLKDMRFSQIARRLQRWYDVDIEFENSDMAHCQFSARFKGLSLPEVLERLRMTSAFTYTITGRKVTIRGQACY